jgi:CTP-dependent riboflavin kinase
MKTKLKPFKAQIWIYPSESASWHFVTLPSECSEIINNRRKEIKKVGRDFGTAKVNVSIGKSAWSSSVFPTKTLNTKGVTEYILPINAKIRRAEGLQQGDTCILNIEFVM